MLQGSRSHCMKDWRRQRGLSQSRRSEESHRFSMNFFSFSYFVLKQRDVPVFEAV